MLIKFKGESNLKQLGVNLYEVIDDVIGRLSQQGVPVGKSMDTVTVRDVQIGVVFDIGGKKQMLSVEHGGITEMFQVNVQLDEEGKIKKAVDNEESTFMDDYSRAVANGEIKEYDEIPSAFAEDVLEKVYEEDGGDIKAVTYRHKETEETVIRYYKNDVLVGEYSYSKKE